EGSQARDTPVDYRSNGITLCDSRPWMRRQLLQSQGDALNGSIVFQHLDLHGLSHLEVFINAIGTMPGNIRNVQQSFNSPDVDKGPETRQARDRAGEHISH